MGQGEGYTAITVVEKCDSWRILKLKINGTLFLKNMHIRFKFNGLNPNE